MQRTRPLDYSSSEDGARPAKRKRVALACESCRERKIKCDGKKPVCGPCGRRNASSPSCGYSLLANNARRSSEQEYIASLRQQVHDLQQAVVTRTNEVEASRSPPLRDPSAAGTGTPVPSVTGQASSPHLDPTRDLSVARSSTTASPREVRESHSTVLRPVVPGFLSGQRRATDGQAVGRSRSEFPEAAGVGEDSFGLSPISAMGAVVPGHEQHSIRRNNEYYGESSLLSLMRAVDRPPDNGHSRRQQHNASESQYRSWTREHGDDYLTLQAEFALPPRAAADKLLDLYFSSVHIFYPWMHSVSFQAEYQRLWTRDEREQERSLEKIDIGLGGGNYPRHVFFSALNAMFALGCQFSDLPSEEKRAASAMFYDRIKTLLRFDILDSGSIGQVQALLLVGQYLLGTQYPTRCWNVVGLACRMAISLGLQSASFSRDSSEVEAEIRHRVWYACLQMDMTVSMTLGRPHSMHMRHDVPLPRPIDDENLVIGRDNNCQPEGTDSIIGFMVQNAKLAKILGQILDRIYHSKSGTFGSPEEIRAATVHSEDFTSISHLDSILEEFSSSVPDVLCWNRPRRDSATRQHVFKRQSNVLMARFIHLKVLLYRPSFTEYCTLARAQLDGRSQGGQNDGNKPQTSATSLSMSLRAQCAVVCVRMARELILSVQKATEEQATGAWWYTLFYLMTSAIILILTECTPSLKNLLDPKEVDVAWERCLATLKLLGHNYSLARHYLHALNLLRQRSLAKYSGNVKRPIRQICSYAGP
ncbi:hypothetical protein jhhlp_000169 [Lomentospora prolificans]|uniref:Zn(2)-C6 fungal-type domain-containing protein n=1 Tax=Lomentospora prolificans TaxID=41688 RepID=A0A2N3NLW8_9PEZI|nr:hypothetical protein jhhlp_000169 [Lomentospora prolificans]